MIKEIEKKIASILIKIFWLITLPLPVRKKKITFISYFSKEISDDYRLLKEGMEDRGYKVVLNLNKFKGSIGGKFKYLFNFIKQVYQFNTSKVVLLDGNNFVFTSMPIKKKVFVVQIWHASGAVKKFGSIRNRRFEIKSYHGVISPSDKMGKLLGDNLNTRHSLVYPLGLPKTDILFDEVQMNKYKEEMYEQYPIIAKKKVVLYAPTFRGDGIEKMISPEMKRDDIAKKIGGNYVFLNKEHPLCHLSRKSDNYIDVSDVNLYKILSVVDYVITDYSAVFFDALAINKEVIFYCPDYDEYREKIGLNFQLDRLPYFFTKSEKELIDHFKNLNVDNEYRKSFYTDDKMANREKFKKVNITYLDGKSTGRVLNYLEFLMKRKKRIRVE